MFSPLSPQDSIFSRILSTSVGSGSPSAVSTGDKCAFGFTSDAGIELSSSRIVSSGISTVDSMKGFACISKTLSKVAPLI